MSCCFEPRHRTAMAMKGFVIPAEAGIQFEPAGGCDESDVELDPSFRRDDEFSLRPMKRSAVSSDHQRLSGQ